MMVGLCSGSLTNFLCLDHISSMLRKSAAVAKLDSTQISPHSFRIGATTWAAKKGFSTEQIRAMGRFALDLNGYIIIKSFAPKKP